MKIETFDDLLRTARQQPDAQRLLFIFAGSELPDDCTPEQRARFEAGLGGALVPMMEVDKLPDELTNFEQLVTESTEFAGNHAARDWTIVFVAALSGQGTRAPTSAEADEPIQRMVDAIRSGAVRLFLTFDRMGNMVRLVQDASQ